MVKRTVGVLEVFGSREGEADKDNVCIYHSAAFTCSERGSSASKCPVSVLRAGTDRLKL